MSLKMSSNGWIRLHRCLQEDPMWYSEEFTKAQAWIDLLMLANHTESQLIVRGNVVVVERGQVARSEDFLANKWKWSRGKVRRFLSLLESEKQGKIVQQKNSVMSIISIVSYDKYQSDDTTDSTTDGQQTVQQTDNRRYTYKNVNNDKNVKNDKKRTNFSIPTLEQVQEYAKEIRFENFDASYFISYYEDKEWKVANKKMKDWKLTMMNWRRRDTNQVPIDEIKKREEQAEAQRIANLEYQKQAMELREKMYGKTEIEMQDDFFSGVL